MTRFTLTKLFAFISTFCLVQSGLASVQNTSDETLYGSSIQWEDDAQKSRLLESAPAWSEQSMQSLFDDYRHPEKSGLPVQSQVSRYNIQFINSHWGPMDNPFNKLPRPAKAFVFVDKNAPNSGSSPADSTYFVAPLFKNDTDGNYYVFDKNQSRPVLLSDWFNTIKASQNGGTLRFNVCNGYGNLPADNCNTTSYQSEASYAQVLSRTVASLEKQPELFSARREIHEDWTVKANKMRKSRLTVSDSILDSSISWKNETERNKLLAKTSDWADFKTIQDNFEKIRDIRYFDDEQSHGFQRRITWLYPDDGCWTRASAAIRDLFGPFNNTVNITTRPSKVFVFGNLCANTKNSPNGQVSWWYHTAPIIRDAQTNQTYVLDPSINSEKPLTMEKWVQEITSNSGACEGSNSYLNTFNICNGYGAAPYSQCQDSYTNETSNMLMQSSYRYYERSRQVELNRDANKVLGDLPPWKNTAN